MPTSIIPLTAFNDTPQNTTSTTLISANCTTAVLPNGVDHFVFYCGNHGGNTASARGTLQLDHGSTNIGLSHQEGLNVLHHTSQGQCFGGRMVTGNGIDALNFKFSTVSNTCQVGAMSIMALPLAALVEGQDYWFSGTNSASYEVSNAVSSWEDLREITFTVPVTGDYMVFPSAEGRPAEALGSVADRTRVRMSVDGTFILEASTNSGVGYVSEWEDNAGVHNQAGVRVMNLTAGEHTMLIECASVSGFTARSDYRRSNIFILNMQSFDQYIQTQDTTGQTTTSSTFADFTGLNQSYTPNQNEHVLHLAYTVPSNSVNIPTSIEIRNSTNSTSHCVDAGEYNNDNGYADGERDMIPCIAMYSEQYSTLKAWRTRLRLRSGTALGAVGVSRGNIAGIESNFISLGLTLVDTPGGNGTIIKGIVEGIGAFSIIEDILNE